jgi:hypothetical protein
MSALTHAVGPSGLTVELETVTPLYTGGIGQNGEQLHPSGMLGSIRRFSCCLANALGNPAFEQRFWGRVDGEQRDHHAKAVGLRWDMRGLKAIRLPHSIKCGRPRGWYFGTAQTRTLILSVIPRGVVSPDDLNLLALALRIQIAHASFGAKDQFGLGVLNARVLPPAQPLPTHAGGPPPTGVGLHHGFFARLVFDCPAPTDWRACLEAGLYWRLHLRNALRGTQPYWRELRHYTMGKLGRYGSAVNVSALYPLDRHRSAIRLWAQLPHTEPVPGLDVARLALVRTTLRTAVDTGGGGPTVPCANPTLEWEAWDPQDSPRISIWINRLAGVEQ